MKKINIIVASLGALALVGCNNDFMDRFPTTSIAPETFFQTEKDLELYTNTYYEYVTPYYFDYVSDKYTTFSELSNSPPFSFPPPNATTQQRNIYSYRMSE